MRQQLVEGVDYDELYKDALNYADAAQNHRTALGLSVPSGGLYSTVRDLANLLALQVGFGPENVEHPPPARPPVHPLPLIA